MVCWLIGWMVNQPVSPTCWYVGPSGLVQYAVLALLEDLVLREVVGAGQVVEHGHDLFFSQG